MTTLDAHVHTRLGDLHVRRTGTGPPAVLWHSLWVDSRSWGSLVDSLAVQRQVVTIDGPGYGASSPIHRDFTLAECACAAGEVLDALGLDVVDWIGNAWGGHVGITLAATQPHRLRSLTTIAAPITPVSRRQRWTQTHPLAAAYRLFGPNPLLTNVLFNVLLGGAEATHPDQAAELKAAFRAMDRESVRRTIRFMHRWHALTDLLPAVTVPTLLMTGDLGDQGWSPAAAQAAADTMPDARVVPLTGAGHVGPLLVDTDAIAQAVTDFWASVTASREQT
ncbi:alpha/beta fold hydrolase [Mycolicibacterium llatzerense]|uniref:Alpha/beta hydrolase n=1 Tax=Mycolicibacterium llatzerense TaxID=280871 RepID=A0A0D1LRG0_9MYCO|nr:alpha/beta hydrolase [Mycolicibacterium llatzerense]KIU18666.1 alpha/beta hydrolase [Mycolicibacterium llatzerense]